MDMIQVIIMTVLVFFVIVTIHEWGHFYFAKRAGILVREFAIGFGPKLFSIKRGETRYTIRLIPAGGFVRMAGEDPEIIALEPGQKIAVQVANDQVTHIFGTTIPERASLVHGTVVSADLERQLTMTLATSDDVQQTWAVHPQAEFVDGTKTTQIAPLNRQFGGKSVGARAMAIFAGPLMNFVLAFVLIVAYIQMAGIPMKNPDHLVIGTAVEGKPAALAGLQVGDTVQAINGEAIGIDFDKLVSLIGKSVKKPLTMTVIRDGQTLQLQMTPIADPKTGEGKVGIAIAYPMESVSFIKSITLSGKAMWSMTVSILDGFKKLILGDFALEDLGGPVRTAQVTGQIAQQGFVQLTSWVAMLSLYIGIFNLLPIPALDGSRLLFLGVEALRGKPLDPNRESMVHFIGFAMLMLLMVAVTYHDILRLVRGES